MRAACCLQDWMFGIEPVLAEVRPSAALEAISEEGEPLCTQQPDWPGRARIVGLGLLFLLALEAAPGIPCMSELPVGELEHPGIFSGRFHDDSIFLAEYIICCVAAAAYDYVAKCSKQEVCYQVCLWLIRLLKVYET